MKTRKIPYEDRPPIDIAYIRVSTDEQNIGMEVQRDAFAASLPNALVLEDEGLSAATMDRPELLRALQMLRDGEARSLNVYRLDRLSRSVLDFATISEACIAEGWRLGIGDCPGLDPTNPFGEAMLGILAIFAQLERKMIAQRTRDGLARVRAEGVKIGRPRSISQELREEVLVRRDAGELLREIADDFNARAIPTGQGAARWTAGTVGAIHRHERAARVPQPA